MKKRLLSLLLAICLVAGLLPTTALAEGTGYTVLEGVSGSNTNPDEWPGKFLDGDITTKWCVTNFTVLFNSANPCYIIFETFDAMTVAGYAITTGNDNAENTGRNPKNWTLYGCNNATAGRDSPSWEEIHKVENDTVLQDQNHTTYYYELDNPTTTAYQYFKLEITANHGDYAMQLSEFELTSCVQHDWQPVTVPPTCTEDGYTCKKCSKCGLEKDKTPSDEISDGHHLEQVDYVPTTDEEVGYIIYKCSDCDYEEQRPDLANAITLELSDKCSDGWNFAQLLFYRDGRLWKTLELMPATRTKPSICPIRRTPSTASTGSKVFTMVRSV